MATLNILINRTVDFAQASNVTPQLKRPTSLALGYHEKILIIIGAVTLVIVSLLIVAIVCIKRRQVNQERDSYKYMCRVDMANMRKELNKQNMPHQDKLNVLDNNVDCEKKLNLNIDSAPNSTLNVNNSHDAEFQSKVSLPAHSTTVETSLHPTNYTNFLNLPTYPCPVHGTKQTLRTFMSPTNARHNNKTSAASHDKMDHHDSDSTSGCSADMSNSDSVHQVSESGKHSNSIKFKDSKHGSSLIRPTKAPELPPRTASLEKTKHSQTGCHGYKNGSLDRASTIMSDQKPFEQRNIYSTNSGYSTENRTQQAPPNNGINV